MLHLEVVRAGANAPARPFRGEAPSLVWNDVDDRPAAYGGADGDSLWMDLPNVGAFRFGLQDERVLAYPDDDVQAETLEDAFRRIVLPMALQARGTQVLHASAVLAERGVVALSAVSGTGKSTAALALSRRGYALWADDAVAFTSRDGGIEAIPLPFALRLWPETVQVYGWNGADVTTPVAAPLAAIAVLERTGEDPGVERVQRDALPLLLDHAYAFDIADERAKRLMVEGYIDLIEHCPVYRVRMASGLETLEPLLDQFERKVMA